MKKDYNKNIREKKHVHLIMGRGGADMTKAAEKLASEIHSLPDIEKLRLSEIHSLPDIEKLRLVDAI